MLATPDSGASVSLISHDVTQKHGLDINKHEKMAIAAANDSSIKSEGSIDVVGEKYENQEKSKNEDSSYERHEERDARIIQ